MGYDKNKINLDEAMFKQRAIWMKLKKKYLCQIDSIQALSIFLEIKKTNSRLYRNCLENTKRESKKKYIGKESFDLCCIWDQSDNISGFNIILILNSIEKVVFFTICTADGIYLKLTNPKSSCKNKPIKLGLFRLKYGRRSAREGCKYAKKDIWPSREAASSKTSNSKVPVWTNNSSCSTSVWRKIQILRLRPRCGQTAPGAISLSAVLLRSLMKIWRNIGVGICRLPGHWRGWKRIKQEIQEKKLKTEISMK